MSKTHVNARSSPKDMPTGFEKFHYFDKTLKENEYQTTIIRYKS